MRLFPDVAARFQAWKDGTLINYDVPIWRTDDIKR